MTRQSSPNGTCRSCNAEIYWIKMKSGKANPCDPRKFTMILEDGTVVTDARVSHFVTCPNADQHRKKSG